MAKMSLKEQREWHRHRPEGAAGVWATVGETGVKIGSAAGLGGLGLCQGGCLVREGDWA